MIEVTQRPPRQVRSPAAPSLLSSRSCEASTGSSSPRRRGSSATDCGSSGASPASTFPGDEQYFVVRQGFAAAIGVVGLVVATLVPIDLWRRYWKLVYGATLGLMVVVFVAAETVRGSKRWLDLGVIQFQPSELGKVLFVLALAGFAVDRVGPTTRWKTIFTVIGLGAAPDPPRVHAARSRHRARVRGGALRRAVLRRPPLAAAHRAARRRDPGDHLGSVAAAGGRRAGPEAVSGGAAHPRSRRRSGRDHLQPQPVHHGGRLGRADRARRRRREPDEAGLPPRARDRLRLRLARGAARVRRMRDPAAPVPPRRLARAARHHRRPRPLRRRRRGRARRRVPLPGLRQRRDDDGRGARHRHSVAFRHRRGLVDGREPRPHRCAPEHPRPRRARAGGP